MSLTTTAHLNFRGQARAALELYASVFGGQVTTFTYGQAGVDGDGAKPEEVMWGQTLSDDGFHVMAFDVPPGRAFDRGQDSMFLSVRSADPQEITVRFTALADGGTVRTALGPAGFAPLYGMVTDRFGITWVMDAQHPAQG